MSDRYIAVPDVTKDRRLFTFNPPIVVRLPSGDHLTVDWAEGVFERSPWTNQGWDLTLSLVHGYTVIPATASSVAPRPPVTVWVAEETVAAKQYLVDVLGE